MSVFLYSGENWIGADHLDVESTCLFLVQLLDKGEMGLYLEIGHPHYASPLAFAKQ